MRSLAFVFLLFTIFSVVKCSKILLVFPMPAYSHFSLGFRLAKELADRGHQVTVISPYPQKKPIPNYRDISVEGVVSFVEEAIKENLIEMGTMNLIELSLMMHGMGQKVSELVFEEKRVQDLLNSKENFDLVIVENFLFEVTTGFAHRFKAPLIFSAPMSANLLNNYLFANPAPSSYIPNIIGDLNTPMNFWERIVNFLSNVIFSTVREIIFLPQQRQLFKKYFTNEIELDDIMYNASLLFTNSHVSVNEAVPILPNIIEIGGYHINPLKEIPEDLQKFLDNAKEGVVLFSLGSNVKIKSLAPEVREMILTALSKIKEKVLWKSEVDLPDLPENVKIMRWVPQQNVLAHPNVKAFISHGGLLSTIETVYYGVPIIGVPIFGDQLTNVARAANGGYALSVPFSQLTEEKLSWALNEILNNPKYRENVKKRSAVMQDQPLKPIDSAIYWIEYVIRHGGAPYRRSAGLDLKWYQRENIDVFAFLGAIGGVLLIVFGLTVRILLRYLRKNRAYSKTKKDS